ncbi:MAG: phage head closure protein [Caldilineaceae bacterium]|nr:phage head closure protein [Caldilineaceae bacterium]MCB0139563.1 phage head closure protein [Caldilineaceae bacterium]
MRTGKLRNRITIQSESITRNTVGEEVISYVDLATVWAQVQGRGGQEKLIAQSNVVHDSVDYVVKIRFRDDVSLTHKQRIKHGSLYLQVLAVFDGDGTKRELVFLCSDEGETV